ncbi:MAG: CDP-alcohol phosphatidyltransferase family protein [Anaerolineales bacterium]|nr:CDP-alcohol phosphatidyltransferase family protein [Anaerolineales bacterium]
MFSNDLSDRTALDSLRKRWLAFASLCLAFLAGGYALLSAWWDASYALRWLALPTLAVAYLLLVLGRNLDANHRADEQYLLPSLGWGNRLTLLRGLLTAAMLGFLFLPRPLGWLAWLPGVLYILSDASDFFDGYLARVTGHATRLGEILDMSFDGLGVMAAALLAAQYGQVPPWYLLVAFARYLHLAGLWLRRRLGKPLYMLPPNGGRRLFAGLMMGFLAAALLPVFSPPGLHIVAALFGLPFLGGFARDWLYVSGMLSSAGGANETRQIALSRWLPFLLRLAVLALGLGPLALGAQNPFTMLPTALALAHLAVIGLVALGVAPRVTAIAGLCILGLYQVHASLALPQVLLAVAYTAVLYLGGGALAWWTPEEILFHQRAGEAHTLKTESAQ